MQRPGEHPLAYARVSAGLAFMAVAQSDLPAAEALTEAALEAARALGNTAVEGLAMLVDSMVRGFQGDTASAERVALEGLDLARRDGHAWLEARYLETLGHLELVRGDAPSAEAYFRASQRIAHERLDTWSSAMALTGLANVLRSQGDLDGAAEAYEAAHAMFRAIDPRATVSHGVLHDLGYVALGRGELASAARLFLESAAAYASSGGDRRALAECVIGLATVAVRAGRLELAARLYAAAEAQLRALGTTVTGSNQADYERGIAALRDASDPVRLAVAWRVGSALTLDMALREAQVLADAPSDITVNETSIT